ncbi:hypothetical protein SAMN02745244_01497 [Tessaracoccus bendigoensis DSM 12906]|uniref:Uncharacterized protein n=1 Tax=Tessaracoccus bendigoensis DSM 12906 TaxID=1123357 RepID=A0A1M6FP88_9ACTN|nr:hypothetical protein [Tessaracoccus bendigoensis]SHI99486.1 hypothetical protein SAMN02745244_01497 [Tessaracoccus bendigoensis DSM 12906]
MQFVLDDQIGRAEPATGADRRGRMAILGGVLGAVLDLATGVVGVDEAVAVALAGDVPEQRRRLALAGQAGELVHRRDHEGGGQTIDLLVDGEDGQPLGDGAALGERALGERVGAADEHAADGLVDPHLFFADRRAAPGTALDL